jgi:hypothetical protein
VLQLAREIEIVGAAVTDDDSRPGAVDIGVAANRGIPCNEVRALDDDIGRAVAQVRGTLRVDRDETDVDGARLERLDHLARAGERDELDRNAKPPSKLARKVDGHAARFARGGVLRGEDRIPEVDRRTDLSGRGEIGHGGGAIGGGGRAAREQRGQR